MELFFYLAFVVIVLGCAAAFWWRWLTDHKTGRRGSIYYVPKFTAKFDPFLPLWTPERRAYVARDKEYWRHQFNQSLR